MATDPTEASPPDHPIRLVVLFGGRSAEHDVSCVTARHVLAAADPTRYRIEPVGITRDGRWVRAHDAAAALAEGADALPDALAATGEEVDPLPALAAGGAATPVDGDGTDRVVVLPLLHGPMGEDGTVQGLLELADVPYVGCGVLASAVAMDKGAAKELLAANGIPQARWASLHADEVDDARLMAVADHLGLPAFVKPANMGSSIGVARVEDLESLRRAVDDALTYDEWLVVEEAVVGRELECGVLGTATAPRASLPGEVEPGAAFYDYEDKYHRGVAKLLIPAPLPDDVVAEIQHLSRQAFRALRADGMARVDFFYEEDGRGLLLNEVNTIPGFTPISMYPRMWEATGVPYPALIDQLVDLALARHARRRRRTDVG